MKFILVASIALFFVHVGRGEDGCPANVDGQQVTLQPGQRYCLDETTSRSCVGQGKFNDDKCPPNSKCMKSPGSYETLCREMRRSANVVDAGSQPQGTSDTNTNTNTNTNTEHRPESQPSSNPTKTETGSAPSSPKEEGKEADQGAAAAPVAEKPETCTANINGTQQTLKPGDRYCVDQKTHRVCNYGEWIDDTCPEGSVCLKSPTSWQVLCRIYVRNAKTEQRPAQEPQHSEPSPPMNPEAKPQPQTPTETKPETPAETRPQTPTETKTETRPETPTGTQTETKPETPAQPEHASLPSQETPESNTCAGGLKVGERVCTGETTFQLCDNGGKLVDDKCPENSQCKQSPSMKAIVCRQYVRNAQQPQQPPNRR